MASRPRLAPIGAKRKKFVPPAAAGGTSPTAPVSKNAMCWRAATWAATAEMALP